jgi:hypothetical protein
MLPGLSEKLLIIVTVGHSLRSVYAFIAVADTGTGEFIDND